MSFSVNDLIDFTGSIPDDGLGNPYIVNPGVVQSVSGSTYLVTWANGASAQYVGTSGLVAHTLSPVTSLCCSGGPIPDIYFLEPNDPSKNTQLFANALIMNQLVPASISTIVSGTHAILSARQFPDFMNATNFYYLLKCLNPTIALYAAYPDFGGSPLLSSALYTWDPGAAGNSCSPFDCPNGTIGAGLDATETVRLIQSGGTFTPHAVRHKTRPLHEVLTLQSRMRSCPFWKRCDTGCDRNSCTAGKYGGKPAPEECFSCLEGPGAPDRPPL